MIHNAFELVLSCGRKASSVFFQGALSPPTSLLDEKSDMRRDGACVGIFICGMGRGVYVYPLTDGIAPTSFQGRHYKLDSVRDGYPAFQQRGMEQD